ncbi:uncharacterized protein LOC107271464, partial [Cephus cinctus]|uniref:Uncharacterized protein LOC107271464 n=1 Tax=Cephus cinctus TaxID=211228 RepID=A0AAJ7RPR8_CEPCN
MSIPRLGTLDPLYRVLRGRPGSLGSASTTRSFLLKGVHDYWIALQPYLCTRLQPQQLEEQQGRGRRARLKITTGSLCSVEVWNWMTDASERIFENNSDGSFFG